MILVIVWYGLVPDNGFIVRIDGGFGFHKECGLIGVYWYWWDLMVFVLWYG